MAVKFYNHDIQLQGNQLIDPRAEELEADPDDRGPGHWFYSTALARFRFNEGGVYRSLGAASAGYLQMCLDNGRRAIPLGRVWPPIRVPWAGAITSVLMEGGPGESGGFKLDVWKATNAATIPTDDDSIVGSDHPSIVGARYSIDGTLTGWSPNLVAENRLWINVLENEGGFTSMMLTLIVSR